MKKVKGSIYSFVGTSIFAANFISMGVLVGYLSSNLIIFLRFSLASIFLFLLSYLFKKDLKVKSKRDFGDLIYTGFLGMSLYNIFFTLSLKYISPSLSSLLCSMIPFLTLFIESILKNKKPKKITYILFLISLSGVYLSIDLKLFNNNFINTIKGIILMFCAILVWIFYTIKTETLISKYDSLVMLAYQSLFGGLISLLLSFNQLDDLRLVFLSPNSKIILLNLLFASVFASALGYYFFNLGIKYLGVTISSVYMNIMPIITILISYLVLDTLITFRKIMGAVIVIIVTYIVTFNKKLLLNTKEVLNN